MFFLFHAPSSSPPPPPPAPGRWTGDEVEAVVSLAGKERAQSAGGLSASFAFPFTFVVDVVEDVVVDGVETGTTVALRHFSPSDGNAFSALSPSPSSARRRSAFLDALTALVLPPKSMDRLLLCPGLGVLDCATGSDAREEE